MGLLLELLVNLVKKGTPGLRNLTLHREDRPL
jgi:hypothetical protein